jgi:hypothetical protein
LRHAAFGDVAPAFSLALPVAEGEGLPDEVNQHAHGIVSPPE